MFSQYPDVEERPITVSMPGDSEPWEVVYSRFARDLGVTLTPGKLSVNFFPGRDNVESWRGCVLITLGCMFAFYIKPILLRRRTGQSGSRRQINDQSDRLAAHASSENPEPRVAARAAISGSAGQVLAASGANLKAGIVAGLILAFASTAWAGTSEPFDPSKKAAELDAVLDWSQARLIAVQDAGRYKTLDSFARESMTAMYGRESPPRPFADGLAHGVALQSRCLCRFTGDSHQG
ncbi:MAG: hypothetical protein IPK83_22610 [Planctomycetes bacterium]|nr:hypothetical protein [Planctomycetota bacterium]